MHGKFNVQMIMYKTLPLLQQGIEKRMFTMFYSG